MSPSGFCDICGAPSCDREHNAPNWPEISRLRNEMRRVQAAIHLLENERGDLAHALDYQYELLRGDDGARVGSPSYLASEGGVQNQDRAPVP